MEKPETLNLRGMELTDAGRYEKAIEAFSQALEQEPRNAGILYNRGEALRRAGETHAWTIVGFTDQATRDAFIVDGAEAADSES